MLQSSSPKKKSSLLLLLLIFIAGGLAGAVIVYSVSTNRNNDKKISKEEDTSQHSQKTEKQMAEPGEKTQEKPVFTHENNKNSSIELSSNQSEPNPDTATILYNSKPVNIQTTQLVIDRDEYVAKDEMITERFIQIQTPLKRDVSLDSILINDKTTRQDENLLHVEFWRSPINYIGYKYRKNKLILFGFYEPDLVKLRMQNEKLAVFYKDNVFLLVETEDFKPLILKRKK